MRRHEKTEALQCIRGLQIKAVHGFDCTSRADRIPCLLWERNGQGTNPSTWDCLLSFWGRMQLTGSLEQEIPLVSKDIYWDCPGVGLNDCRDPRIRGGIILREEYAQRTLRNPSPILLEIRLLRDLFSLIICIKLWYLVVTKLLRWNSCSVLKSFHLRRNKLTLVPSPICQ